VSVYSGTFTPTLERETQGARDAIADARELLRQAARVPFAASKPMAWHSRFSEFVLVARRDIARHIVTSQIPGSPMSEVERTEPRLQPVIDRQREEHEALVREADELVAGVGEPAEVDIWRMIELGEKAILLEMALARHHNRLVRLVYESTNLELGGEA
jgi:hypothetical protein